MGVSPCQKLKLFQIRLSDPNRSFYTSGEKVSGSVQLEADRTCSLSRLRVTAAGSARVQTPRKNRVTEVDYLKYEDELRLEEHLQTDSDGRFLLPAGRTFSFPFGFLLPDAGRLVSSYKGKFGSVRYYICAELDRPSQNALRCEMEFEVEEPLDINRPELLAPAAASKQKKVTCMFIPDGQVSVSAQIDRKGYCEGEDISINAKFENTTSRIVVPKAAIVAKHSYIADGRTKVSQQKLSAVRGNHIISGMCDMWQSKTIRVPRLRPTLLGCDIIKVDYVLLIYLHVPGSEKLTLELPLVIGTVPFSGVGSRTGSVSSGAWSRSSQASFPSVPSFPSAPPSYGNIRRDLGVDGPRTPLLDDYDGEEDEEEGLFMTAPALNYPPAPPPAYSQVEQDAPLLEGI